MTKYQTGQKSIWFVAFSKHQVVAFKQEDSQPTYLNIIKYHKSIYIMEIKQFYTLLKPSNVQHDCLTVGWTSRGHPGTDFHTLLLTGWIFNAFYWFLYIDRSWFLMIFNAFYWINTLIFNDVYWFLFACSCGFAACPPIFGKMSPRTACWPNGTEKRLAFGKKCLGSKLLEAKRSQKCVWHQISLYIHETRCMKSSRYDVYINVAL